MPLLRILHASRCLPGAWPEARKIIQHMNGEGFRVKHKRYVGSEFRREWSTADVLLLGCDSKEWRRTIEALTEMERGLLGVWRGWDVLWYFADGRVPQVARIVMAIKFAIKSTTHTRILPTVLASTMAQPNLHA